MCKLVLLNLKDLNEESKETRAQGQVTSLETFI